MCLLTNNKIQIAEHDIKVFKCVVVRNDYDYTWRGPLYSDKTFPFNTLIVDETPFVEPERSYLGYASIGEGFFHSFEFITAAEYMKNEHLDLHIHPYHPIRCECTIPKGTLYFHDECKYASKAIIVHRP